MSIAYRLDPTGSRLQGSCCGPNAHSHRPHFSFMPSPCTPAVGLAGSPPLARGGSIEQLHPKRFAFLAVFIAVVLAVAGVAGMRWILLAWGGRRGLPHGHLLSFIFISPLDDLVEFAAIEPNTTALGAVVDLDALPLTHDQIGLLADGTFHGSLQWRGDEAAR